MSNESFYNWCGFITKDKAVELGFTHHGSYYGIPVWMTDPDEDDDMPMVGAKWLPFDFLMTAFHYIEGLFQELHFFEENLFHFNLKDKIQDD